MAAPFDRIVTMAPAADVRRSVEFYTALGFRAENIYTLPDRQVPIWAYLVSGGAHLMVTAADAPLDPATQSIMFYLYVPDVEGLHGELSTAGLSPGPIEKPFFSPLGEFRLVDPDGHVIIVSHSQETE